MGNQASNQLQIVDKSQFNFIKEIYEDSHYGNIKLYQHITKVQQYIAVMTKQVSSDDEINAIEQLCSKRKRLQHKNLVKMLDYQTQNSSEFLCSQVRFFNIGFKYYTISLQSNISKRRADSNHIYFQEGELWLILVKTLKVLAYMSMNKEDILDLSPTKIAITAKRRRIKLIDSFLCHFGPLKYQVLLQRQTQLMPNYLPSPEILQNLKQNNAVPNHDPAKSVLFSLGMVLLEAASLQDISKCYDFIKCEIDYEQINEYIQSISSKYSQYLLESIKSLANSDPLQRKDFQYYLTIIKHLKETNEIQIEKKINVDVRNPFEDIQQHNEVFKQENVIKFDKHESKISEVIAKKILPRKPNLVNVMHQLKEHNLIRDSATFGPQDTSLIDKQLVQSFTIEHQEKEKQAGKPNQLNNTNLNNQVLKEYQNKEKTLKEQQQELDSMKYKDEYQKQKIQKELNQKYSRVSMQNWKQEIQDWYKQSIVSDKNQIDPDFAQLSPQKQSQNNQSQENMSQIVNDNEDATRGNSHQERSKKQGHQKQLLQTIDPNNIKQSYQFINLDPAIIHQIQPYSTQNSQTDQLKIDYEKYQNSEELEKRIQEIMKQVQDRQSETSPELKKQNNITMSKEQQIKEINYSQSPQKKQDIENMVNEIISQNSPEKNEDDVNNQQQQKNVIPKLIMKQNKKNNNRYDNTNNDNTNSKDQEIFYGGDQDQQNRSQNFHQEKQKQSKKELQNEENQLNQSSSAQLKYKIQITQPENTNSPVTLYEFKNQVGLDKIPDQEKDKCYKKQSNQKEFIKEQQEKYNSKEKFVNNMIQDLSKRKLKLDLEEDMHKKQNKEQQHQQYQKFDEKNKFCSDLEDRISKIMNQVMTDKAQVTEQQQKPVPVQKKQKIQQETNLENRITSIMNNFVNKPMTEKPYITEQQQKPLPVSKKQKTQQEIDLEYKITSIVNNQVNQPMIQNPYVYEQQQKPVSGSQKQKTQQEIDLENKITSIVNNQVSKPIIENPYVYQQQQKPVPDYQKQKNQQQIDLENRITSIMNNMPNKPDSSQMRDNNTESYKKQNAQNVQFQKKNDDLLKLVVQFQNECDDYSRKQKEVQQVFQQRGYNVKTNEDIASNINKIMMTMPFDQNQQDFNNQNIYQKNQDFEHFETQNNQNIYQNNQDFEHFETQKQSQKPQHQKIAENNFAYEQNSTQNNQENNNKELLQQVQNVLYQPQYPQYQQQQQHQMEEENYNQDQQFNENINELMLHQAQNFLNNYQFEYQQDPQHESSENTNTKANKTKDYYQLKIDELLNENRSENENYDSLLEMQQQQQYQQQQQTQQQQYQVEDMFQRQDSGFQDQQSI